MVAELSAVATSRGAMFKVSMSKCTARWAVTDRQAYTGLTLGNTTALIIFSRITEPFNSEEFMQSTCQADNKKAGMRAKHIVLQMAVLCDMCSMLSGFRHIVQVTKCNTTICNKIKEKQALAVQGILPRPHTRHAVASHMCKCIPLTAICAQAATSAAALAAAAATSAAALAAATAAG